MNLYGIFVALGVFTGWLLALRRRAWYRIAVHQLELLFPWLIIAGLVGARVYHVLDKFPYYQKHPLEIIMLWQGGLGIFGALIGGGVALVICARIWKVALLPFLDLLAPCLLLGQAVGRLGNMVNQEGFGPPTQLPWGIFIDSAHRPLPLREYTHFHPTPVYESLWLVMGTMVLLKFEQKGLNLGQLFSLYLIWFGVGRFFFEFLRFDTAQLLGIRMAHLLSVFAVLAGSILFTSVYWSRR